MNRQTVSRIFLAVAAIGLTATAMGGQARELRRGDQNALKAAIAR